VSDPATPDLFAAVPPVKPATTPRREQPLELRAAMALCRRMRRVQPLPDKQRLAHQICGTLIALCKKSTRGIR
jgi:hypothetical protein